MSKRESKRVCLVDVREDVPLQGITQSGERNVVGRETENIIVVATHKVRGAHFESCTDSVSVEEPLEINVRFELDGCRVVRTVAVTMRTPGHDAELAAGFLFAEGVISKFDQIESISKSKCNGVVVSLKPGVSVDVELFERHSYVSSSCGVCGKKSIASVMQRCEIQIAHEELSVQSSIFATMSRSLRLMQSDFDTTGGIHAAALFDSSGRLTELREDVGRHNALDKLIGAMILSEKVPLNRSVLFLSGRASFELIQKAAAAGIQIVASVGAPSSLAVQLASECGMTLIGFVREDRFNIYCGSERVVCAVEKMKNLTRKTAAGSAG